MTLPEQKERRASDFVRFMRKVRIGGDPDGCWEWTGSKTGSGPRYGAFSVRDRGIRAHRWLYETVCGAIPDGLVLRHSCDNTHCVNPAHLMPGTQADNNRDMHERGRAPLRSGAHHPLAVLTDDDARSIRKKSSDGATYKQLAVEYGVCWQQIGRIVRRENWSHVI